MTIHQLALHPGMRLRLQAPLLVRLLRDLARRPWAGGLVALICRFQYRGCRAGLVIGVDAPGIVPAACVARRLGVRHALISYELLFESETGAAVRTQERDACRGLAFAIVQDEVRGAELARENGIDPELMHYMPVASSGEVTVHRGELRRRLGIPEGCRVAMVIGSTDDWTGFPDLARSIPDWPDDWRLVVHHRYGLRDELARWVDPADLENVYISTGAVASTRDMGGILGDADLGIALYLPDRQSDLSGRNLECIGMASGKIATFLQFGVPVMVNEIGAMADYVRRRDLGTVIGSVSEVPARLRELDAADDAARARCRAFFAEHLDVRVTGHGVFAAIDQLLA